MSLMQVRNWRRTHRRQKISQRALSNLLWTSCRLTAIGLVGIAFLFYRLDMPGTLGIFTATAETDPIEIRMQGPLQIADIAAKLHIEGPSAIIIPAEGEVTETYVAVVLDEEGREVVGQAVTWSLESETAGVSVADGVVTVTSEAVEGSFTLTAALAGQEEIQDTITVQLLAGTGGGAGGAPAEGLPPGEGEMPPIDEGETPPEGEEEAPSEGEEPPAEDEQDNNNEEPGEEPADDAEEPGDDEVPPEEVIREADDSGADTGGQAGDDDDQDPGGGGEEALPREDDEHGDEEGGDSAGNDDPEPHPEEDGGPAVAGGQGEAGNDPGGYEEEQESGADLGAAAGAPEADNAGKSEPAGE